MNATSDAGQASGSVQGINSLTTAPPPDRKELFEYAIRKDFFDNRLRVITGKQSASVIFANVNRPETTSDKRSRAFDGTTLRINGQTYQSLDINPTTKYLPSRQGW